MATGHTARPPADTEQAQPSAEQRSPAADGGAAQGNGSGGADRRGGSNGSIGASPAASGSMSDAHSWSPLTASIQLQQQPSLVVFSGGTAFNTVAGERACLQLPPAIVVRARLADGGPHASYAHLSLGRLEPCARGQLLQLETAVLACGAPDPGRLQSEPSGCATPHDVRLQGTCERSRQGSRTCCRSAMTADRPRKSCACWAAPRWATSAPAACVSPTTATRRCGRPRRWIARFDLAVPVVPGFASSSC